MPPKRGGLPSNPSLPANPMLQPQTAHPVAPAPPMPMQAMPPMSGAYNPAMFAQYAQHMGYAQPSMMMQPYQTGYHWDPSAALRAALFQAPAYQQPQNHQQEQQQQPPPQQAPPPAPMTSRQPNMTSSSSTSAKAQGTSTSRPPKRPRPVDMDPDAAASRGPWRNCQESGCSYVGADKDVTIHEEDRHLIFKPGRKVQRSEEEERALRGPPPAVQGTGLTLQTPEEIEVWIAQRKARWPTAARVAEKEKERQERIARGELDTSQDRRSGGRGRGRGRGEARGRGRGRGQGHSGRGGGGAAGTRHQDGGYRRGEAATHQQHVKEPASPAEEEKQTTTLVSEAPARSIGLVAYGSDSDEDDEQDSSSSSSDDEEANEAPAASPVIAQEPSAKPAPPGRQPIEQQRTPEGRIICRYFARNGKCNNGRKCRFAHVREGEIRPAQKGRNKAEPTPTFQRPSLLGALLDEPIAHTLSQISQAIHFLVSNDFLENVELEPGQAEEVERLRNMVTEVEE